MCKKKSEWARFLERFDGSKGLSELLGVQRQTILTWKVRGIPMSKWASLKARCGLSYNEIEAISNSIKKN